MDAIEKELKKRQIWRKMELIGGTMLFIILVIALLIKGCQNNKFQLGQINQLIEKHNTDSIKMFNDSVDFANRMQYAEGKLELNYNQYISSQDSIGILNDKLAKSKAKRIIIEPKLDTSIMEVPTEFVSQCNDCWGQLDHYKSVVDTYTAHSDSLRSSYLTKNKIQEQRIKKLNEEKGKILSEFNECVNISKAQQKRYEPRRQLKMLFSPASIGQIFPNSIGFGGLYEDKKERDFGAEYFLTPHGPMYMLHCALPLSLTRKK